MKFHVEMVRPGGMLRRLTNGPDMARVTFRDGPKPDINVLLRDEDGDIWVTSAHVGSEVVVEFREGTLGKALPKGAVLESVTIQAIKRYVA